MTRPTNPDNINKEAQLQQAIAAFRKKKKTAKQAISDAGVSRRTFYYRLKENVLKTKHMKMNNF